MWWREHTARAKEDILSAIEQAHCPRLVTSMNTQMNTPKTQTTSRLDREVEREQDERHRNDDAKSGMAADEEFRSKDARESSNSGQLNRSRRR